MIRCINLIFFRERKGIKINFIDEVLKNQDQMMSTNLKMRHLEK